MLWIFPKVQQMLSRQAVKQNNSVSMLFQIVIPCTVELLLLHGALLSLYWVGELNC